MSFHNLDEKALPCKNARQHDPKSEVFPVVELRLYFVEIFLPDHNLDKNLPLPIFVDSDKASW